MNSSDTIIGIDLGTTHSLVSVWRDGKASVIVDGDSPLIHSVVAFDDDGSILSAGQKAHALKLVDPTHVIYSFKRLMGKGKKDLPRLLKFYPATDFSESTNEIIRIKVGKYSYTPIELSAEILKRCRDVASNYLGEQVSRAVITVPAYFNDAERSATTLAGKLAGLSVERIVNEPTAAALAYGLQRSGPSTTVAVYDFGGGTFDMSLLKLNDGIFEVVATHGDTELGGDDLDHAIADFLIQKSGVAPQSSEDKLLLLSQAEVLKKELSTSAEIAMRLYWDNKEQWSGILSTEEILEACQPVVSKTLKSTKEALDAAEWSAGDVDHVVMVGGSTKFSLVRAEVEKFFNRKPNTRLNPDEVVAVGAAIQGSILKGDVSQTLLLDVVPLSLGLETMGGVITKIIQRNSTLPCSVSEMFTTYADNQTSVDLHIVQGERELAADCRSLGRFKLKVPPSPAGIPKIRVDFMMDANGVLKVIATDTRTNGSASLDIKPSFGLNDNEIEKMLRVAFEHAEADMKTRQLIEVRQEARSLLKVTVRALKNPLLDEVFKKSQVEKLSGIMKALEQDIQSAPEEVVRVRIKQLEVESTELAEKILTQSIRAHVDGEQLRHKAHS